MSKERLHYIDIAKGLLILFVIAGHLNVYSSMKGIDVSVYGIFGYAGRLWSGFFMQAFFFITGFCSSFNKPWQKFLSDNAKTIIFPIVPISLSLSAITLVLHRNTNFEDIENAFLGININYWFLLALFLGKCFYWPLRNLSRIKKVFIACLIHLIGFIVWNYHLIPNVWYIHHSLLLMPFLIFGDLYKEIKDLKIIVLTVSLIIYSFLLFFCSFINQELTIIAWDIHLTWINLTISIPLALSGSLFLVEFCKIVKHNAFLEYLGRNTLSLFMIHLTFMTSLLSFFNEWIERNSVLGWITVFISTLLCSLFYIFIHCCPKSLGLKINS